MIKIYLKNYRGYRDLVSHLNGRIALATKMGIDPANDLQARDHFKRLVEEIDIAIGRMSDPDEQRLLRLRYLEGWSWTKVSLTIHYSRSQTKRIHAKALAHLEEITTRDGLLWEEEP